MTADEMTRAGDGVAAKKAKLIRFPPDVADRIDDYRWGNRIGSESEAIRQIIVAGLDAIDARKADKP